MFKLDLEKAEEPEIKNCQHPLHHWGFLGGSDGKASACSTGDLDSIPGLGRSPGEGNGNPLLYSCLEYSMDGGAWWAIVYGVAKSRTQLNTHTQSHEAANAT